MRDFRVNTPTHIAAYRARLDAVWHIDMMAALSVHLQTSLVHWLQGSKDQLEEVWEEDGLDREDFDPKTFFFMHGPYTAAASL